MANTLVTDIDKIAQKTLAALTPFLINISAFSSNFSDEALHFGTEYTGAAANKLIVKQYTYPTTAARNFRTEGTTGATNGNYLDADDVIVNPVEVKLDKHLYKSHVMTDYEIKSAGIDSEVLRLQGQRLLADAMSELFSHFVAANFPEAAMVVAPASFDSDNVLTMYGRAGALRWPKQDDNRSILLNTDAYVGLLSDSALKNFSESQDNAVLKEAQIKRVRGFNIFEFDEMPDNGEDLIGVATTRNALAVAGAVIDPGEIGRETIRYGTATDPVTGLTVGVRMFYESGTGKTYFVQELLFGAKAVGPTEAILIAGS